MNPGSVVSSSAPVRALRKLSYQVAITFHNLRTNGRIHTKALDVNTGKPYISLTYNDITASAIAKVGKLKDPTHFSGLINFDTGQMHLTESGTCERLAKNEGLDQGKINLKTGWYAFSIYYTGNKSRFVEVSPWSHQFGGIPIEYSAPFESYMKGLFSRLTMQICFWQLKYERALNLDDATDEKRALLTRHVSSLQMALVPTSLSNDELKILLPKELSCQIFASPQGLHQPAEGEI